MTQVRKYPKPVPKRTRACCDALDRALDPKLFKCLCDPTRLGLLVRLAGCCDPLTVGEIAGCCCVDMSVVSRHLTMLRDAGVLDVKKEGRSVLYCVRYAELARALRSVADAIDRCAESCCAK